MGEFWSRLLDTTGFIPRKDMGPAWTAELIWLHVGSDLFIWLAFLSIPLVLLSFTRRRNVPFNSLFLLFAVCITACGFTHLFDGVMFETPIYRLAGLVKVFTAVTAWITVVALIRAAPRVSALLETLEQSRSEAAPRTPATTTEDPLRPQAYIIAIIAGVLAILVRSALDPLLKTDHAFELGLVAVVYVAWQCGFGPALVTLLLSMSGIVFFFVGPRDSFVVADQLDQLAVALFFFCGVGCAALGEAQRLARKRARAALAQALEQKAELEAEVARRRAIEQALRQREVELRDSAERFRLLTEAVPQMVWTADPTGQMTYANRRWDEYTGRTSPPGKVHEWGGLVHPADAEGLAASWQLALTHQADGFAHEFRLRRASDAAFRWMLSAVVPLRGPDGSVTEWVGTLTDIDDQKRQAENLERMVRERTAALEATNAALQVQVEERTRAEARLQAVARELGRSNRELEQFAYVASHDLQEPLRKIQAFGDRLRDKCREQISDLGRGYIDRMLASAGRMRRLIDDLLTFSRVTTHARPFTRVDLNQVLREVIDDLDARIEQSGGTVEVGSLPEIDADPSQVHQLFQNLFANALKFHKPGVAPVVRVWGELLDEPGQNGVPVRLCRVNVSDNGIGFEEKYLDRIFQVFQRLHGRSEYEGTGVGLAICKKIVERHGGTITATSAPDRGTTFTITLPLRQPDPPSPSLPDMSRTTGGPDV